MKNCLNCKTKERLKRKDRNEKKQTDRPSKQASKNLLDDHHLEMMFISKNDVDVWSTKDPMKGPEAVHDKKKKTPPSTNGGKRLIVCSSSSSFVIIQVQFL